MMKIAACLFLALAVCQVSAQKPFVGSCPTQSVVSNFDAAQYLGKWFENRNYFAIFQIFGRCVAADYADAGDGLISVTNSQKDIFGNDKSVKGQAKLADPSSTDGKLSVSFASETPYSANPTAVTDANYLVLDTDYTSYSIVWSCTNGLFFNYQLMWLLTREQNPPQELIDSAIQKITDRGLDASKLRVTDQSNCS